MLKIVKVVAFGAVGLLLGAMCAMLGIGIAGGGHGWITAFFLGWFALAFSPPAFIVLALSPQRGKSAAVFLVTVGAILDFFLLLSIVTDLGYGISRGRSGSWVWLACWFPWQIAAVVAWRRCERPVPGLPGDDLSPYRR